MNSPDDYPIHNITAWVAERLPHAIAFAEREMAETARAREYHLARAVERGTCAVGHDLAQPTPINRLGTHPCGYCTSAKAFAEHCHTPSSY